MAEYFVDLINGDDNHDGLSFAQRKRRASSITPNPGDRIRIMMSPNPASVGINATWTDLSKTVTLSSSLTQLIDDGESAWTASVNVTSTADTTQFKSGTKSSKHDIATGFTTGLVSYFATSTLNLSAYQQVSFWVRNTVAIAANTLSLRLCSDTAGATSVTTIAIPAIPSTNQWTCVTVDTLSALPSSVKSVALYQDVDIAAVVIQLDNINACLAPGNGALTLNSLVGKLKSTGAGGDDSDTWWGIQSINGTTVLLDNYVNTLGNAGNGYSGTSETVALYKRECIPASQMGDGIASSPYQVMAGMANGGYNGVFGNPVIISGGWNTTDMTTQVGATWIDGQNGWGEAWAVQNFLSFVSFEKIAGSRCQYGFVSNTALGLIVNALAFNNCSIAVAFGSAKAFGDYTETINVDFLNNNEQRGVQNNAGYGAGYIYNGKGINGNGGYGIDDSGLECVYTVSKIRNNTVAGISAAGLNSLVVGATFDNNGGVACDISGAPSSAYSHLFRNCTINDATFVSGITNHYNSNTYSKVYSHNHGAVGTHKIVAYGYTVDTDPVTVHTAGAGAISWKVSVNSLDRGSTLFPTDFKLCTVACKSGQAVTVTAYVNRSNTGLTVFLKTEALALGAASGGATSSTTASASAGAWELLTLTWTPAHDGLCKVYLAAYGGTTYYVNVDDITVSGAYLNTDLLGLDVVSDAQPMVSSSGGGGAGGGGNSVILIED